MGLIGISILMVCQASERLRNLICAGPSSKLQQMDSRSRLNGPEFVRNEESALECQLVMSVLLTLEIAPIWATSSRYRWEKFSRSRDRKNAAIRALCCTHVHSFKPKNYFQLIQDPNTGKVEYRYMEYTI